MVLPHLLEHREQSLLIPLGDRAEEEVHQSFLVGLDPRRKPQCSGFDIADEMGSAALERSPSKYPYELRERLEVALRRGIGPADGGVAAEGEHDGGDKAGLIAASRRSRLELRGSFREIKIGGYGPAWDTRLSLKLEHALRDVKLGFSHGCLRRGRSPSMTNGKYVSHRSGSRRVAPHAAMRAGHPSRASLWRRPCPLDLSTNCLSGRLHNRIYGALGKDDADTSVVAFECSKWAAPDQKECITTTQRFLRSS